MSSDQRTTDYGVRQMARNGFILRMAHGENLVDEALKSGHLIIGWAEAEGLLDKSNWEEFREIIHRKYYSGAANKRRAGSAAGNMWTFIHDMKKDDLVVVPHGPEFYVGKVTGPAFWDKSKVDEDTAYRRPVEWLNGKHAIPRAIAKSALVSRMKTRGTTAKAKDLVNEINGCLKRVKSGIVPSFETDLRDELKRVTLDELRSGIMDSFRFESLIKSVFSSLGAVEVEVVWRGKDKGIDVYATFLVAGVVPLVVGVQAKHFQQKPPVSADVICQLIHGIENGPEQQVALGMVITSGTFSDEAEAEAKRYEEDKGIRIELIDGEQFAGLIVEHGLKVMS